MSESIAERIARDPAFKVGVSSDKLRFFVEGPDGPVGPSFTWYSDAERNARLLNTAFYLGVHDAERKANTASKMAIERFMDGCIRDGGGVVFFGEHGFGEKIGFGR